MFHLLKLILCGGFINSLVYGGVLMKWDFQGASPLHDLQIEGESPKLVDDPLHPGSTVMLAELLTNSTRGERSEVRWDGLKPGKEYWVGVELLIPEANLQEFVCTFQIGPIKYSESDKANGGYIQTVQRLKSDGTTEWVFRGFFDRFGAKGAYQYLGALPFGKWQKWIFHVIPRSDDAGLIEAWLEGQKIYSQKGKAVKDEKFILLPVKWGVYIGIGNVLKQNTRSFYRQVILADETFDFEKMNHDLVQNIP
jgi:hypothetical protein